MMYLVSYSSTNKFKNLRIIAAIKEQFSKWAILSDTVFIVVSDKDVVDVRNSLQSYIHIGDKIFVTKISAPAAWTGYSNQFNEWLQKTYQEDKKQ